MRFRKPSLAAAICLLFSHAAPADVIFLKNGEKLEGVIVREDDEKYVVEVKVSASIRDEKTIPRAEVQRIEKEAADAKAFADIEGLVPAPELLTIKGYEARIEKLEGFLKEYPGSGKEIRVRGMIDVLKQEFAVISLGGIKLGGEMVTAEDYAANAYGYDARISEKRIKDAALRGDLLVALRLFEGYELGFGDAEGRPGLAALMVQVLGAYRANVSASLGSLESRLQERQTGLERMSPEDRARTERAIQEETDNLVRRFADEKTARVKWVTPDAFHKESLDETLRQIAVESGRLEQVTAAPAMPLAEVYRNSWEKLPGGTDEEKKAVLDEAKANKLPDPYLAKLYERAGLPLE